MLRCGEYIARYCCDSCGGGVLLVSIDTHRYMLGCVVQVKWVARDTSCDILSGAGGALVAGGCEGILAVVLYFRELTRCNGFFFVLEVADYSVALVYIDCCLPHAC